MAEAENPPSGEPADETEETPEFTNRAARRAKARGKGKGAATPQSQAKGAFPGGRGGFQAPRNYGNRRSG